MTRRTRRPTRCRTPPLRPLPRRRRLPRRPRPRYRRTPRRTTRPRPRAPRRNSSRTSARRTQERAELTHGDGAPGAPHPGRLRPQRLATAPSRTRRATVVPHPPIGAQRARQEESEAATAGRVGPVDRRATVVVVAAVITGVRVVLTQAEVPNEPHHEQADVEDPEADHEDPALRAHMLIVPRRTRSRPASKSSASASPEASSSIDPIT